MFASKAQTDRFPHRVGPVRLAYPGTLNGEQSVLDPRPFDPTMNNEPNPILVDVRRYVNERSRMNQPKGWPRVLQIFNAAADYGHFVTGDWERVTSPEMLDHARRVLTRLAKLGES